MDKITTMKIAQLSQKSGLSKFTIRYYEKIKLLDKPQKDQSGHRDYGAKDIEIVNWVTCLKKSGMPLEKIKTYTKAYKNNDTNIVSELLDIHLMKLKRQQKDIEHYIEITEKKLKKLKDA